VFIGVISTQEKHYRWLGNEAAVWGSSFIFRRQTLEQSTSQSRYTQQVKDGAEAGNRPTVGKQTRMLPSVCLAGLYRQHPGNLIRHYDDGYVK
jgi:hypothetical protein